MVTEVVADPFANVVAIYGPDGTNAGNPVLFVPSGPVVLASLAQAYALIAAEVGAAAADAWVAPLVDGRPWVAPSVGG